MAIRWIDRPPERAMSRDWNPMPHTVAVACPHCASEAMFEFAEAAAIQLRKDLPYFAKSRDFELVKVRTFGGGFINAAVYYHGLDCRALELISDLPEGYSQENWKHPPYLYRSHGSDIGTLTCKSCALRRKHELDWPNDAFFQISYRNSVLWAFDRGHAVEVLAFVESTDRAPSNHRFARSLRKIPTHFLASKARATVAKRLKKRLAA